VYTQKALASAVSHKTTGVSTSWAILSHPRPGSGFTRD
jgi:hypothetical protein